MSLHVSAGQKVCLFILLECIVDTRGYFEYSHILQFPRLTSDSASEKDGLRHPLWLRALVMILMISLQVQLPRLVSNPTLSLGIISARIG